MAASAIHGRSAPDLSRALPAFILAGCLALLLLAAPADAKKKKKPFKLGPVVTVTASATAVGDSQPLNVSATCPPRRKAVGGGWTVSPVGDNFVTVFKSVRGPGESWTTGARTFGASAGVGLTTYAYCRKTKKAITDFTSTATVPGVFNGQATASVQCPAGSRLLSGGFESTLGTSNDVAFPLASYNSGGAWTYTAQNASVVAKSATVHGYCTRKVKPATLFTQALTQTVPTSGSFAASTPACGKKKPRLGAGGFIKSTPSTAVPVITDNRIVGASWQVTSRNTGPPLQTTLTAQGICLQK